MLFVTRHTSHVTRHTSHFTHSTSHTSHRTSHITHHTSHHPSAPCCHRVPAAPARRSQRCIGPPGHLTQTTNTPTSNAVNQRPNSPLKFSSISRPFRTPAASQPLLQPTQNSCNFAASAPPPPQAGCHVTFLSCARVSCVFVGVAALRQDVERLRVSCDQVMALRGLSLFLGSSWPYMTCD